MDEAQWVQNKTADFYYINETLPREDITLSDVRDRHDLLAGLAGEVGLKVGPLHCRQTIHGEIIWVRMVVRG